MVHAPNLAPEMRPNSVLTDSARLPDVPWPVVARRMQSIAAMGCLIILVVWSAVLAKTASKALPLADIRIESVRPAPVIVEEPSAPASTQLTITQPEPLSPWAIDPEVRWFNGRPVKPSKSIWMTVTAYSPDARSCGESADGITSTLHSVETNAFHLVAADPTVLAYGSMLSIDGYDKGEIVPVLDCGGAIKGHRLDVLFPTHEQARGWGVRKIKVVVWAYVDGKPAENPRAVR